MNAFDRLLLEMCAECDLCILDEPLEGMKKDASQMFVLQDVVL